MRRSFLALQIAPSTFWDAVRSRSSLRGPWHSSGNRSLCGSSHSVASSPRRITGTVRSECRADLAALALLVPGVVLSARHTGVVGAERPTPARKVTIRAITVGVSRTP